MKFSERNTIKDLLKITAMKITKITSVFICLMLSILLLVSSRFSDDPWKSGNKDNPLAVIAASRWMRTISAHGTGIMEILTVIQIRKLGFRMAKG
jgi:hypothetical protein